MFSPERESIAKGNEFIKTIQWLTVRVLGDKIELTAEANPQGETRRAFSIGLKNGYYSESFGGTQGEKMDGRYCDRIKLSQRTVEFGKEGGRVVVASQGDGWWLGRIQVGGKIYVPNSSEEKAMSEGQVFEKKIDWLTVRSSYKQIELIAEPNLADTMRTFSIDVTAFLNFTGIEGVQQAK